MFGTRMAGEVGMAAASAILTVVTNRLTLNRLSYCTERDGGRSPLDDSASSASTIGTAGGGVGQSHRPSSSSLSDAPIEKILIHFVCQGAPPPPKKKNKVYIGASALFSSLHKYLRDSLSFDPSKGPSHQQPLFLYIDSSFAPGPDDRIVDLYRCFGMRGELIVNYCLQHSYG